ncbi:Sensor histidine kinase LiaS [Pontiella sulfatireligans]|uniref:histidine kinase n=2 Tax=Pontiella sulfatireligans TaxID=2750658 RepID=A0A6C2UR37_9BACT|nr:Sensor histidine kinase LiaS [Pontiella sulfatireligans]
MFHLAHQHQHTSNLGQLSSLIRTLLLFLLFVLPVQSSALLSHSSNAIQQKIDAIETELQRLPEKILITTPATLGYRSTELNTSSEQVEIEVLFPETAAIDLVVLMPAVFSDGTHNFRIYGFPERFLIERIFPDGSSDILADFRNEDYHVLDLEPQLFPCPDTKPISGIRVTSTRSPANQPFNRIEYAVAFSELYAFAGNRNIALHAPIKASNAVRTLNVWSPQYLVDGFTISHPINPRIRKPQVDYLSMSHGVILNYDLEEIKTIDELRLWPAACARPYRPPFIVGADFPTQILFEKLDHPNDPTPDLLYQTPVPPPPHPGSHPFMLRLPSTKGRYFRLSLSKGFPDPRLGYSDSIALGEIELIGNGKILSGDTIPETERKQISGPIHRKLHYLKDKKTSEGNIVPLRQWLEQFSLQRNLIRRQKELQIQLELTRRQEKQRSAVLITVGYALIIILALMVLIARLLASRRWNKMREQIAADLHDEVGANLSGIAHSTEMAMELIPSPDPTVTELLNVSILAARQTAIETRNLTQLLENRKNGEGIDTMIRTTATRILGNMDFSCTFNETLLSNVLKPTQKWDLLFFVKEALNNIIKHAEANHVAIETRIKDSRLQLSISDNGKGIPNKRLPLRHLEDRAKRLKGKMQIESKEGEGTRILLTLSPRKIR